MSPPSEAEVREVLRGNEKLISFMAADGFFASKHNVYPTDPHVVVTDQRIALFSRKGMMKKRLVEDASWALTSFTSRLNNSEGTALGPFMYMVTLFTHDEETVSTGFKSSSDAESFSRSAAEALAPVLG